MKTFLESPKTYKVLSQKYHKVKTEITKLVLENNSPQVTTERLYHILKKVFVVDTLILSNPSENKLENANFCFPAIKNSSFLLTPSTEEQHNACLVLGDVVRSADQKDHLIINEALSLGIIKKQYNLLFYREVHHNQYLPCIYLIRHDAIEYNEIDVTALFFIVELLSSYWYKITNNLPKDNNFSNIGNDDVLLSNLPGMQSLLQKIWVVSRYNYPVLLLGETGTGKEVVANTIYRASTRYNKAFVKMNCANMPDTLSDSKLFGHEKGSFTGAIETVKGSFERADKGTLLLDEVAELSFSAQVKLLRVLQEKVIERVGGYTEIPIDVRIIAATNRNLEQMIAEGVFREDLYYRLNLITLHIPALRERQEDIKLLVDFFLENISKQIGLVNAPKIQQSLYNKMKKHSWNGNVRELQNLIHKSILFWIGKKETQYNHVLDELLENSSTQHKTNENLLKIKSLDDVLAYDEFQKLYISEVLTLCKGKIEGKYGAAEYLKLNPSTLRSKIKKLNISSFT